MSGHPDETAVLVALWRALHLELDDPPHVCEDPIGLELIAPSPDWRGQPAMAEEFSRPFRALMVGRARLVEDEIASAVERGVGQYVVLGAGLDTFALPCPAALASRLTVFEVDEPDTQSWKRRRLRDLGRAEPAQLRFAPVDFETGQSWAAAIGDAGFDATRPAVVSALGLTQYVTEQATTSMLAEVASLAPGTILICGFNPPDELIPAAQWPLMEQVLKMVAERGCPWISRYSPERFAALARTAGLAPTDMVDPDEMARRYFAGRTDELRPSLPELFLRAEVR